MAKFTSEATTSEWERAHQSTTTVGTPTSLSLSLSLLPTSLDYSTSFASAPIIKSPPLLSPPPLPHRTTPRLPPLLSQSTRWSLQFLASLLCWISSSCSASCSALVFGLSGRCAEAERFGRSQESLVRAGELSWEVGMERYEVIKDIGSGNFGVAKLVRDVRTKELFAVKFIERGQKVRQRSRWFTLSPPLSLLLCEYLVCLHKPSSCRRVLIRFLICGNFWIFSLGCLCTERVYPNILEEISLKLLLLILLIWLIATWYCVSGWLVLPPYSLIDRLDHPLCYRSFDLQYSIKNRTFFLYIFENLLNSLLNMWFLGLISH